MRILYGVVGEGMGHATRSRVVIEHLARAGHRVRVVVSGRAHQFLVDKLRRHEGVTLDEIHGLTLRYFANRLRKRESLWENLRDAPEGLRKNLKVYRKVAEDGFDPEVVISDFESWAALYALNHRLPVISIDNMQVLNRCQLDPEVTGAPTEGHEGVGAALATGFDFRLARLAVKMKMPGAYHYVITSFYYPPVRKKRTTLVPPILRPEILAARREPGEHVLVYQTASTNSGLIPALQRLPHPFRVYGMGREGTQGNVELRPFSETTFVDDLRTARAVIAGGGFSLMSEAVSLGVPLLSVPIEGQYEQELNARYLAHLGYGDWTRELHPDVLARFLGRVDDFAAALGALPRRDNTQLFGVVDELLARAERGEKRPKRVDAPAMGKWGDAPAPEADEGDDEG